MLKTFKKLCSNVALDKWYHFLMLMLHSWRTFRLLSPVLSGWFYILTVKAFWYLFH